VRVAIAGHAAYAYTGSRGFDPALPTIVFVHGAAHDHSVWALQSRYFAHHGRNALAIDLPGHGRSDGKPLASVPALADWLIGVLDALEIEKAALVGHSMGALAVLDAAGRYPARVAKLALLGPAVPMPVADVLLEAAKRDDHVAFELINGWSFSPRDQLGGNRLPGVWMTGNALRLMERSRPGALYVDLLACQNYADGLTAADRVRCPTLVILGQRDLMAPAKNSAALIAALGEEALGDKPLGGRRFVTIPDCGHSLMAEAPDLVLDTLREFLLGT
jgi:pimeloyl-ACP methyl ester carboxylesterase